MAGQETRLSRSERAERSREVILDASVQLFAQRGFDGVTLDEISNASEVKRSLILYYYRSKEELWRVATQRMMQQFFSAIEPKLAAIDSEDARERLHQVMGVWVDAFIERPEVANILVREGGIAGPRLEWLVRELHVPTLPVETIFGDAKPRRAMARAVITITQLAIGALGPLLSTALSSAIGQPATGIFPLSKRNRDELIDILCDLQMR